MNIPTFRAPLMEQLPVDPVEHNTRRQVFGAYASRVHPTPVSDPRLIAWSREVADSLGLPATLEEAAALADVFGGNRLLDGMDPHAACYGGHQFGGWAGQLGDGRAISLGSLPDRGGELLELQLKGAGPTPYSRRGDGRAVLRSSIREFLCSEAMHHLGIPTTRALSLVTTGDQVVRDMFYDGNPRPEPGAIVCRVAPTFLRFGNFQLFASRRDEALLRALADYTITHHFPTLELSASGVYGDWFREICARTGALVAHWMRVGFVHGVLNTDNMSILGLTMDYGPYGWIDDYDPGWTPNTTDAQRRRYAFGRQPHVVSWNLLQLAEALWPLVQDEEALNDGLQAYADSFGAHSRAMWAQKLGLREIPEGGDASDPASALWLVDEAQRVMLGTETDMTLFFRALADVPVEEDATDEALLRPLDVQQVWYTPDSISTEHRAQTLRWLRALGDHARREAQSPHARHAAMRAASPRFVLRNYLAQLAIDDAEQGDLSTLHELFDCIRAPYEDQPRHARFAAPRPDWARHRPGCSMLSCSS